jgi:hypothetical protein
MSITLPTSGNLSFRDIDTLYVSGIPYTFTLTGNPETVTQYHNAANGSIAITFLNRPTGSNLFTTVVDGNTTFFDLSSVVGQSFIIASSLTAPYTKTVQVTDVVRALTEYVPINGTYGGSSTTYSGFSGDNTLVLLPLSSIRLSDYGGQDCDIAPPPATIRFSEFQGAVNYPINLELHFTNSNLTTVPEQQVVCNINGAPTLIPVAPIYISYLPSMFLSTKNAHVDTNNYVMCDTPITASIRGGALQTYTGDVSLYIGISGETKTVSQGTTTLTLPLVTPLITHANPGSASLSRRFTLQDFSIPEHSVIVFYLGPGPGNSKYAPTPGWHLTPIWSSLGVDIFVPNEPRLSIST